MIEYVSPHGYQLAYSIEGEGPGLVLIHGFGLNSSVWDQLIGPLSAVYKLIRIDLPGFGKSELPDSYTMESLADVFAVLLEKAACESCVMVGHSMGGYAGLAFAEKYPGLLSGLSLCHSHPFGDDLQKKEERRKSVKFIKRFGQERFIEQMIPGLFALNYRISHTEKVDQFTRQAVAIPAETYIVGQEAMIRRPDRRDLLRQNKFPVQLIIGEEDGLVPRQQLIDQSYQPDIASVHLLEGVGHMGMIEQPGILLNAIGSFADLCFDRPFKNWPGGSQLEAS